MVMEKGDENCKTFRPMHVGFILATRAGERQ